jgi:hypothetical protein
MTVAEAGLTNFIGRKLKKKEKLRGKVPPDRHSARYID